MADPYSPKLASFSLNVLEQQAVAWALQQNEPWGADTLPRANLTQQQKEYSKAIKKLKKRIKKFHLKRQDNCCCYCFQNLKGRNIEQDREHIIPKSEHRQFTFSIENLAVACKTCNMSVKGAKTLHLRAYSRNGLKDPADILNPRNYNIPHPNIHKWEDHISFTLRQKNKKVKVCHYKALTKRGRFAYYFFRLDQLEIFANVEKQRRVRSKQPLHPELVALREAYRQ